MRIRKGPLLKFAAAYLILWALTAMLGLSSVKDIAAGTHGNIIEEWDAMSPAPFIVRAWHEYSFGDGEFGGTGTGTYLWVFGYGRQLSWKNGSIWCGVF